MNDSLNNDEILKKSKQKKLGLYIHIPFCEKKCDYCNFVSFCLPNDKKIRYVDALCKEIEVESEKYKPYYVDTIYIGGGTPTVLPSGSVRKIVECIKQNFNVANNAEISIECNPNSLTEEKLDEFKNAGINRLSIGLQTYNDKLLKLIGRLHTKKQFDKAIEMAKQKGFQNISVDLILGIPTQKMRHIKSQLKHIKRLNIQHISAYGLIVEENTKLYQNLKNKIYELPNEELQVKMYDYTKKYLQKNGFFMYEVSNFSKPNYESKHNLKYWTNQEYLGLGLNSSSYVNDMRWKNTARLDEYIENFATKNALNDIKEEIEIIDTSSQIEECVMLSLRTIYGIDLIYFKNRFKFDLVQKKKVVINKLKDENLITVYDNRLVCTDLGFKLLNQVIIELID